MKDTKLLIVNSAKKLSEDCNRLISSLLDENEKVHKIHNPLDYAWNVHKAYIEKYCTSNISQLILGLNPGPYGMGQTGIPFGATNIVRDFLKLTGYSVGVPKDQHPARKVHGLTFERQEISGTRLWNGLAELIGEADEIHKDLFVINHCPLLFMEKSGKNITPDKLSGPAVEKLLQICDAHLIEIIEILQLSTIIAVGRFAEKRAKLVSGKINSKINIKYLLHPSPQVPAANKEGGKYWLELFRNTLF